VSGTEHGTATEYHTKVSSVLYNPVGHPNWVGAVIKIGDGHG
jgi:hypothetical protein